MIKRNQQVIIILILSVLIIILAGFQNVSQSGQVQNEDSNTHENSMSAENTKNTMKIQEISYATDKGDRGYIYITDQALLTVRKNVHLFL